MTAAGLLLASASGALVLLALAVDVARPVVLLFVALTLLVRCGRRERRVK